MEVFWKKCIVFRTIIGIIITMIGLYGSYMAFSDDTNIESSKKITEEIKKELKVDNNYKKLLKFYNTNSNVKKEKNENSKFFKKVTSLYESNSNNKLKTLLLNKYPLKDGLSYEDEAHGYVVAAYNGSKNFRQAAIEILKRDLKRKRLDYSLKEDLAHVLRNEYLLNGLYSTTKVVEYLKKKYSTKLASHVWPLMPLGIMRKLKIKHHSTDMRYTNEKDLNIIIKEYPNDRYIEYAYYLLKKYDEALVIRPNSPIKDVLLYASAFKIVKKIQDINRSKIKENKILVSRNKIQLAIGRFKEYVELYPKNDQADDAAFWLSWLYLYINDMNNFSIWFNKIDNFGNKDYMNNRDELILNLLKNYKNSEFKLKTINYFNNKCMQSGIFMDAIKKFTSKEIIEYTNRNGFDSELQNIGFVYLIRTYIENGKLDEIEKVIKILKDNGYFKDLDNSYYKDNDYCSYYGHGYFLENINKQLNLIEGARKRTTYNEYVKVAIKLRKNYYYSLSKVFLNESIQKFKNFLNVDYLAYLRILALRDDDFIISLHKIDYLQEVDKYVNFFIENYPNSNYLDDVLAEKIYIESWIFNDIEKAENTLNYLLKNNKNSVYFPSGNAKDNAYNWIAISYSNKCMDPYSDYSVRILYCDKAKIAYANIKELFPNTRFKKYAISNLIYIARKTKFIIQKIQEGKVRDEDEFDSF